MAYRARCIGGYLLVDRVAAGGTWVRCRLPIV
jgi:signal transduction histidine kinase